MSQTTLNAPFPHVSPPEAIGPPVAIYGGGSEASVVTLAAGFVAAIFMLGVPIAGGASTGAVLLLGSLGVLFCLPCILIWTRQRRCHLVVGELGFEYTNHRDERRVTEFTQMSKLVRESGLLAHYIVYLKDGTSFRMMFLSYRAMSEGWEVLKKHM